MPESAARIGVPAGDADVDARVQAAPALAERRDDRAVDRPDEAPGALLDRPAAAGGALQRGLDLGLLLLERLEVALEVLAGVARGGERVALGRARVREARPAVDELALDRGDLVAAALDRERDLLLAVLEAGEALAVATASALASLMIVRMRVSWRETRRMNSVRSRRSAKPWDSSTTVTMSGRSALYISTRRVASVTRASSEARAQPLQALALLAQPALQALELGALVGQVGLDAGLAGLQGVDVALEGLDPVRVGRDVAGQHALAALLLLDRAALGLDPVLQVGGAALGRSARGEGSTAHSASGIATTAARRPRRRMPRAIV